MWSGLYHQCIGFESKVKSKVVLCRDINLAPAGILWGRRYIYTISSFLRPSTSFS